MDIDIDLYMIDIHQYKHIHIYFKIYTFKCIYSNMCTFKYMYLSVCVYSNILTSLYIYIFKLLTFGNHDLSGPGPSSRDITIIMQLVAELLS